jgi:hypothetical protein
MISNGGYEIPEECLTLDTLDTHLISKSILSARSKRSKTLNRELSTGLLFSLSICSF